MDHRVCVSGANQLIAWSGSHGNPDSVSACCHRHNREGSGRLQLSTTGLLKKTTKINEASVPVQGGAAQRQAAARVANVRVRASAWRREAATQPT